MTEQNKISIADYAAAAGISKQAVYKRLKTSLKEYVITDSGGRKWLAAACLDTIKTGQGNSTTQPTVEQPFIQRLNNHIETDTTDTAAEIIKQQAATIAALQKQVETLETHIMQQSTELTAVIKQQQALQEQLQAIIAIPQIAEAQKQATVSTEQPTVEQPNSTFIQPLNERLKGLFHRFKRQ